MSPFQFTLAEEIQKMKSEFRTSVRNDLGRADFLA